MIPDYQTLMRPVLQIAATGEIKVADAIARLAVQQKLTDSERAELLPSGKQAVFANRVHWAKTYLGQAGLLRSTRRGYFEITRKGIEVLQDEKIELNAAYLERFNAFQEFKDRKRSKTSSPLPTEPETPEFEGDKSTPDELLNAAYKRINSALTAELLDKFRSTSPAFFENVIVQLFVAMGYGGSSDEAGRALGRSGDDGVDGVIDQDTLGVDQIYIQAKRNAEGNNVGAGALRDFFGALSLKKAQKGVFVTTSDFSPSARETAKGLGSRIVLIDGKELARLALRFNIGCRVVSALELKRLDEEFFEEI